MSLRTQVKSRWRSKGSPGIFLLQCTLKMMEQLLVFFVCLRLSLFICKRQEHKARPRVSLAHFYLCMTHTVNQRDLRQKYFFDICSDEWEITMEGSTVLQTRSCWTTSSAVIPFSLNRELLNSSGVALNNKVSTFLV